MSNRHTELFTGCSNPCYSGCSLVLLVSTGGVERHPCVAVHYVDIQYFCHIYNVAPVEFVEFDPKSSNNLTHSISGQYGQIYSRDQAAVSQFPFRHRTQSHFRSLSLSYNIQSKNKIFDRFYMFIHDKLQKNFISVHYKSFDYP